MERTSGEAIGARPSLTKSSPDTHIAVFGRSRFFFFFRVIFLVGGARACVAFLRVSSVVCCVLCKLPSKPLINTQFTRHSAGTQP